MIDTHCHLTYDPLLANIDAVLARAREAGVHRMICIGTTPDDATTAVGLTRKHDNLFATAGIHPAYTADWTDPKTAVPRLRELLAMDRVVAVGEMGLDKHYPDPPISVQEPAFEWQLALMNESSFHGPGLPGVIHNREATDQVLATLRASGIPGDRFVFHCFTGDQRELDAILDFGAMVSFTGIVTFKSAAALADAMVRVPADRIMIETDSPYLTPEPHRKVKTNEPCYVPFVAKFLAAKRGEKLDAFVAQVDANARRFFRLPE